ncbi:MAG TPA: HD domain-containing protein, partial [Candidatus Omnitrophota bacterium]|nr:HD domain-containing protein [Candidatus Omnitrophota bacterium]
VFTVGDVIYFIDAYLYHILKNKYPIHEKNLLIAELGTGSLDVSAMAQGYTLMNVGLPLGMLRLKQLMSKLDGNLQENYEAVKENIEEEFAYLKRELATLSIDDIILIDENYTTYLPKILSQKSFQDTFFQLNQSETEELVQKILDKSPEKISEEYKIPLESAETFAGYAMILNTFANLSENKNIYILEASLSEAVLTNMILDFEISQKYNKTNQLISIAKWICKKYHVDLNHVEHVAQLSETLFNGFKETLGLKKTELLYLLLATYLHPIGMFVYNRAHHKHTEYLISNLNLFRLTDEEIKMIACIARYHRRGLPADTHMLYRSLPKDKQILIQKLSAILRISNALDRSHKQKIKKLEVGLTRSSDIILTATIDTGFVLEKLEFMDKKTMFEEIAGKKINLKIQYSQ